MLVSEEVFIRTSMAVDNSIAIRKLAKGGRCTTSSVSAWYKDHLSMCEFNVSSEVGNIRVFVDAFVTTFE